MPSPTAMTLTSRVRRLTPWAVGALIIAWLLWLTPFEDLRAAVARVPVGTALAVISAGVLAGLALDALSTWIILRRALPAVRLDYPELLLIRGTTYLLGLINYGAGQGGVAWHLVKRHRVPPLEAVGAMLLVTGVSLAVVSGSAALGVLVGGAPAEPVLEVVVLGVAALFPLYLVLLALRPPAARKIAMLRPLVDVGLRGNLVGVAARFPQFVLVLATHALVMHMFGIEPSASAVLTLLPLVMFVSVVPVSPFGLGTSQATAVLLFAPYADGATTDARQAAVLGYSLLIQFASLAAQALVGLISWSLLRRHRPEDLVAGAPEGVPSGTPAGLRIDGEADPDLERHPPGV